MFPVQRFRQHERAIGEVQKGESGRGKERCARVDISEEAAHHGSEDEAKAEGGPDHAKRLAAILRLGDVRDIGIGGRRGRPGNAGQGAAQKEQPD